MKYITQGKGISPTTASISQAVVAGNYCHISGQLSVVNGVFQSGTVLEEAKIAFTNLFAVLEAADFERKNTGLPYELLFNHFAIIFFNFKLGKSETALRSIQLRTILPTHTSTQRVLEAEIFSSGDGIILTR